MSIPAEPAVLVTRKCPPAPFSAGHIPVVAAYDLDRMHRDMLELEEYITICGGDYGIATHSVTSGETRLDTVDGAHDCAHQVRRLPR